MDTRENPVSEEQTAKPPAPYQRCIRTSLLLKPGAKATSKALMEKRPAANADSARLGEAINYRFSYAIQTTQFDEVVSSVQRALTMGKFSLVRRVEPTGTVLDIHLVESRFCRILAVCNLSPDIKLSAMQRDGLLLSCNIVVKQAKQGHLTLSFMDPMAVLLGRGDELAVTIAHHVRSRLKQVCASVAMAFG